jgi:hypothetical protein
LPEKAHIGWLCLWSGATLPLRNYLTTIDPVRPALPRATMCFERRPSDGPPRPLELQPELFLTGAAGTSRRRLDSLTDRNTQHRQKLSTLLFQLRGMNWRPSETRKEAQPEHCAPVVTRML